MSIVQDFHHKMPLPTPEHTGIGEQTTKEANAFETEICMCRLRRYQQEEKEVHYSFNAKDRAIIGKYAAEDGNLSSQKKSIEN